MPKAPKATRGRTTTTRQRPSVVEPPAPPTAPATAATAPIPYRRRNSLDEQARGVDIALRELNQYFTPDADAHRLVASLIDALERPVRDPEDRELYPARSRHEFVYIEPGAGGGSFLRALLEHGIARDKIIAIEIDEGLCEENPRSDDDPGYVHADFLASTAASLPIGTVTLESIPRDRRVIIGNPPFSRTGSWTRGGTHSMPLQFINHAASLADTVAFLLGVGFRRESTIDRVNPSLHLVLEQPLPRMRFFDRSIQKAAKLKTSNIYQIWRRRPDGSARPKNRLPEHAVMGGRWKWPDGRDGDFRFLRRNEEGYNLAVARWRHLGRVVEDPEQLKTIDANALDGDNRATGTYLKIECTRRSAHEVAEVFRSLRPQFDALRDRLGGLSSISCNISMSDVVCLYQTALRGDATLVTR